MSTLDEAFEKIVEDEREIERDKIDIQQRERVVLHFINVEVRIEISKLVLKNIPTRTKVIIELNNFAHFMNGIHRLPKNISFPTVQHLIIHLMRFRNEILRLITELSDHSNEGDILSETNLAYLRNQIDYYHRMFTQAMAKAAMQVRAGRVAVA